MGPYDDEEREDLESDAQEEARTEREERDERNRYRSDMSRD